MVQRYKKPVAVYESLHHFFLLQVPLFHPSPHADASTHPVTQTALLSDALTVAAVAVVAVLQFSKSLSCTLKYFDIYIYIFIYI